MDAPVSYHRLCEMLFASAPGMIEFRMPLSARYVQRNRRQLDARASGVSLLKTPARPRAELPVGERPFSGQAESPI